MFAQLPIRPRFQLAKYGSLTTAVLLSFAAPVSALAAPGWTPSNFLDQGRYISKDVELVDLDNDGWIDILFANASWGNNEALPNQAYRNVGGKSFVDISKDVFGLDPDMVVEIRSCDLDNDGDLDLVLGATQTRKTRLLRNEGEGVMMTDITATHMNFTKMSVSDIECGDVDGDGDLDLALAQLGAEEGGAPALLWTNRGEDGDWSFEGSDRLPADKHFIVSSDVEFVDVDNDYDLDLIVSCWACENALFVNDGDGFFTKYSPPSFESYLNHGFEPMDLNGDGYLDLLSLSDGEPLDFQLSRHRLLVNDAHGGFGDMTEQFWSNEANYPAMDRVAIFLDYNSDGAADYILGSSTDMPDRLMVRLDDSFVPISAPFGDFTYTRGTMDLESADLNGDGRPDVVLAAGSDERGDWRENIVLFGAPNGPAPDTTPPMIRPVEDVQEAPFPGDVVVRARVHDYKTPNKPHDWQDVDLEWGEGELDASAPELAANRAPMRWYGEHLFIGDYAAPNANSSTYRVCAVDIAGNKACSEVHHVAHSSDEPVTGSAGSDSMPDSDTETTTNTATATTSGAGDTMESDGWVAGFDEYEGCACDGRGPSRAPAFGLCLAALWLRRRRR